MRKVAISKTTGASAELALQPVAIDVTSVAKTSPRASQVTLRTARRAKARLAKKQLAVAREVEEQVRKVGESILFGGDTPNRVLGFTSAVAGEGRTFLAAVCADALARSSGYPVVLLEWDWDHPSFDALFKVPAQPGLAEWLQGDADLARVRHRIGPNLTVICGGQGANVAARLLRRLREPETLTQLLEPDELVVVDLPPVLSCAYGKVAAGLADGVVMVVRAGVTQDSQVEQACVELGDGAIRGVLLNQMHSHVPGWLRSIL